LQIAKTDVGMEDNGPDARAVFLQGQNQITEAGLNQYTVIGIRRQIQRFNIAVGLKLGLVTGMKA
jgi:hypothetical protein